MSAKTLRGRIERRDLEGGIFQLVTSGGARYTLLGSPSELSAAAGSEVEVTGTVDEGGGIGFAMAGPQFRVQKLKKLR
jgi:hypothetical protein